MVAKSGRNNLGRITYSVSSAQYQFLVEEKQKEKGPQEEYLRSHDTEEYL